MSATHKLVRSAKDQQPASPASPPVESSFDSTNDEVESAQVSRTYNRQLYVSHFLSTWNVRGFEFGAVLFLATIFPGTLLPMSIYALVRAASAILLSPVVGRYIDSRGRLEVIRVSIGKSFGFPSPPYIHG
jgi:solute carrier family 40 (iron-regulated transporter), member 1